MYHITTEELEYFFTVAQTKNFTEAAHLLYKSQPTITKWIKRLEQELDLSLFIRNSKSVELTSAGALLYQKWMPAWESFQTAISDAQSLSKDHSIQLSIGALNGFAYDEYLSSFIDAFEKKYPNLKTTVSIYDYFTLQKMFLEHKLDIIFTTQYKMLQSNDITSKLIGKESLRIAISTQHPLCHKELLTMQDLNHMNFCIVNEHSYPMLYQLTINILEHSDISYTLQKVANQASQRAMIRNTMQVAIVNESFNHGCDGSIVLKPCKEIGTQLEKICCWHIKGNNYAERRFLQSYRMNNDRNRLN